MMAPRRILETEEDYYHILDWKSLKLPRVARSSLSAEGVCLQVLRAPEETEPDLGRAFEGEIFVEAHSGD